MIAPPTFPFVLTFQASRQIIDDPELGLDYSRVVHGEQRFAYARPVRAGDVLTVDRHARDGPLGRRPRHDHLAQRRRHRRGRARRAPPGPPSSSRGGRADDATVPYDDVEVGTELPPQTFTDHAAPTWSATPAPPATSTSSTGTSGSPRSVGLPDVIAHGMFTMALAARVVTDWAGDPGAVVEYGVRFTRPVPVPDDDDGRDRSR